MTPKQLRDKANEPRVFDVSLTGDILATIEDMWPGDVMVWAGGRYIMLADGTFAVDRSK